MFFLPLVDNFVFPLLPPSLIFFLARFFLISSFHSSAPAPRPHCASCPSPPPAPLLLLAVPPVLICPPLFLSLRVLLLSWSSSSSSSSWWLPSFPKQIFPSLLFRCSPSPLLPLLITWASFSVSSSFSSFSVIVFVVVGRPRRCHLLLSFSWSPSLLSSAVCSWPFIVVVLVVGVVVAGVVTIALRQQSSGVLDVMLCPSLISPPLLSCLLPFVVVVVAASSLSLSAAP